MEADLSSRAIAGLSGPGIWLVFHFAPAALFSLKSSQATSTVGRSLLLPTPYAIKMALLDAGLRTGRIPADAGADGFVKSLAGMEIRIGVPERAAVTHTIVKIRQEPKVPQAGAPYIANVAYREFVHLVGEWKLAVNLTTTSERTASLIAGLMPLITHFGKRASFVQYLSAERIDELPETFTVPMDQLQTIPLGMHVAILDDYGPEVTFDVLNSYSKTAVKREKHRRFVRTVVPLRLVRSGPGFSEYESSPRLP